MGQWILVLLIGLIPTLVTETQQAAADFEPGSGGYWSGDDGLDDRVTQTTKVDIVEGSGAKDLDTLHEFVVPRKPPGSLPEYLPEASTTDDIIIEETASHKPLELDKTTYRTTSRTQTIISVDAEDDHSDGSVNAQKPTLYSFLLKDPLILAGIIGGAVFSLLCIVLLVMFTIYRMRKKDEGSYALDEPKKSYGFAYTRARDQEFFA